MQSTSPGGNADRSFKMALDVVTYTLLGSVWDGGRHDDTLDKGPTNYYYSMVT